MTTGRRVVGAIAGMAVVILAGAGDADAYVRRQSATGAGLALMPACLPIPIVVYPDTFTQMTIEEITGAVTAAAAAWSAGANPCTFIEFGVTVVSGPAPPAGNDGRITIVLRSSSWCDLDATGACDPTGVLYDPVSPALTSVSARSNGEIVDADIEINAFHYQWADVVAHPELTGRHDLQNVLTHEIGHLLGLGHSCFSPGTDSTRPNDNAGQPIPDCATAPASVQATTMFPSDVAGDVERRTLEPDDRAGVCGIYPAAATPCPPGGAGCSCPPPGTDGGQDASGNPDALPADAPPADALPADAPPADALPADAPPADAPPADAPPADAPPADAAPADAGKMSSGGGGCNCDAGGRSSHRPSHRSWPAILFLAAALGAIITRPRRRSAPQGRRYWK